MNEHTRVLVGVDGSPRAHQATRYAALEARRLELPLTVVHVSPDYVPVAPMMPLIPGDLREIGRHLLSEAVRTASAAAPEVEVTSRLLTGHPAAELVHASAGARLLVLGHESAPAWGRMFTGAVTLGAAAWAECPVVSVPDGWTEPTRAREAIAVGFKSADHDASLLKEAFEIASARGAHLTILHAWELPGFYDDIIMRRTHDTDWNLAALEKIELEVAELRADHQDVDVDVRVMHRQPAQALREVSHEVDLLMLARRGDGFAHLHLGGTARAMLHEAACPVEVVPARRPAAHVRTPQRERSGHR